MQEKTGAEEGDSPLATFSISFHLVVGDASHLAFSWWGRDATRRDATRRDTT